MKKKKKTIPANTQPVNTAARLFLVSQKGMHTTTPSLAPFLCKACGREFRSREELQTHKNRDHQFTTVYKEKNKPKTTGIIQQSRAEGAIQQIKVEGAICLICRTIVINDVKKMGSHMRRQHNLNETDPIKLKERFRIQ